MFDVRCSMFDVPPFFWPSPLSTIVPLCGTTVEALRGQPRGAALRGITAWPRGAALRGQPDFSFPPLFHSGVFLVEKVPKPL
jgi:hypothetical protein